MPVTTNTQGDNENNILTGERLNNLDMLAQKLEWLKIKDSEYYESESAIENDAKGDPERDLKLATHTSGEGKRKVTNTSNVNLEHKLLRNRTLPIITTTINPRIDNMVVTCGGTPHALATPTMKGFITDAPLRSACILQTHGHVSRTGMGDTTLRDGNVSISPP